MSDFVQIDGFAKDDNQFDKLLSFFFFDAFRFEIDYPVLGG
jgi:hypothetical protein